MISFYELSPMIRGLFGTFASLLSVVSVYILVTVCILRMERRYVLQAIVLIGTVIWVLQEIKIVSVQIKNGDLSDNFLGIIGSFPWISVVLILLVQTVCAGLFLKLIWHRKRNMLTPGSLKESLDTLPDGVCFFEKDGQPLLVNTQMNRISSELFDTEILNGEQFWTDLRNHFPGIVETEDGKIWDFRRKTLKIRRSVVYELTAGDVTEQYRLRRELEKRNMSLGKINERLRLYGQEVDRITREQEILSAKIRLHDDVGRSLLAFRSYLAQPEEKRNRDELLRQWYFHIGVLRKEASPTEKRNHWALLQKAAKAVDVKILLEGEIPKAEKAESMIIMAIHECLTNTVKHAKGNELYVKIFNSSTEIIAEIRNNGKAPVHTVKESGGLLNLRHIVERAGGRMEIKSTPQFVLRVTLMTRRITDGKDKSDDCR